MPRRSKKPLFSVIVPAYNVEKYISKCIDSVLAQSLQDFELILVDDGSTDGTGGIFDRFAREQAQPSIVPQNGAKVNRKPIPISIKAIHQPNAGLSAARNTGVDAASGEYLIFLDGDDYLEKNALETIQKSLDPGLDLLRYQAREVFADGREICHEETGFAAMPGTTAFKKLARYHYTENVWLYAYRREFFTANGFRYAEGRLAEDLGLTPLVIAKARSVKAIPDICYNYRQREGSIMHDEAKLSRRIDDIMQQYQKTLPEIASIAHTEPILHYLVVSFLTGAAELGRPGFLRIYQDAKRSGMLRYIHPSSLKSLPRSLILRYFPNLFYWLYHR